MQNAKGERMKRSSNRMGYLLKKVMTKLSREGAAGAAKMKKLGATLSKKFGITRKRNETLYDATIRYLKAHPMEIVWVSYEFSEAIGGAAWDALVDYVFEDTDNPKDLEIKQIMKTDSKYNKPQTAEPITDGVDADNSVEKHDEDGTGCALAANAVTTIHDLKTRVETVAQILRIHPSLVSLLVTNLNKIERSDSDNYMSL
jgi:RNAse (barnase) inhibitor barstar